MATEGGWDIGCFAACLIAAALSASGAPLAIGILLGLPGIAVGMALLWRYYAPRAVDGAVVADTTSSG